MKLKSLLCLIILGLSGCATHRVGDFTLISTKNININSSTLVKGERVHGVDKSTAIAYMKNSVDDAIEQHRCAVALSDAVIKVRQELFSVSYITEGNLVIDKSLPGCK
ncbi:hypothetical protein BKG95_00035 [Rodentibacter pneumotropicus]|uniref:Lipoprotein n=1 Tax=Rodentibacter pneumotropicus TaxID=758 RepID=A0AAW5LAU2_9PAST|nr:hypothetical protein [Rodentibacter pneumotropicus]MCQ9120522.1 hypothetical protein [Rodentibacter pneumotropicus]OOF69268.1 hypothetical protein BKG95_00035 [Rodentibacter pneumotropicus]